MITKKSWKEFRETGLLWFINSILHLFGWAIVVEMDDDKLIDVYPARVTFRGFDEASNTKGYTKISRYLYNEIDELLDEAEEQ